MDPLYPTSLYSHEKSGVDLGSTEGQINTEATCPGRIAVYDSLPGSIPRTVEIAPGPISEFLDVLTQKTHELAGGTTGSIPFTVIRELVENFIHAGFCEPVISIIDNGQTIRFADQGPGIEEKEKATLPGFTSASKDMKVYIRGVGSGLPVVSDFLSLNGGSLIIEDNLGQGTVVTITTKSPEDKPVRSGASLNDISAPHTPDAQISKERSSVLTRDISGRQMNILALMVEKGPIGPTVISEELGISNATAHRDLEFLESQNLVISRDDRKRVISDEGFSRLDRRLH